jgi:hypothetical protein
MLDGSRSIDGMLYMRADRSSYHDWAAEGAPGWATRICSYISAASETADGRDIETAAARLR